jgi:glycosyltransferase involved in cell wall biosynthesis
MNVLIIGPSVERSKGGTATVIYEHINNPTINKHNKLRYMASHVDGSRFEKAYVLARCLFHILIYHNKYDIIHIHANSDVSFYRKTVLLRVCRWFNKKTILHMHGHDFDSFYRNNKPYLKRYIKNSVSKSNLVIVLSDYWKRFLDSEFANLRSEILHNGIDVKAYQISIKNPTEFTKYLFMGRLGERKGVYDLIKAIDIIVNQYGRKELKFYLAGDGDLDKVEKIINSQNLADNVKILGWLNNDDKRKILKEVETVVLPSYEENLPMALIEAMACGKVIISTYAGGIPDLVKPDFNGYLFNAGDIDQLVKYILFVNENPNIMMPICQNNIDTINEKFNLDTLSVKLNSIYRSL